MILLFSSRRYRRRAAVGSDNIVYVTKRDTCSTDGMESKLWIVLLAVWTMPVIYCCTVSQQSSDEKRHDHSQNAKP